MKGKKGIYIMLPLVLAIWFIIGYRIYNAIKDDGDNKKVHEISNVTNTVEQKTDSFTLIADYRDPFLEKSKVISVIKTNTSNKSSLIKSSMPIVKKTTPWPSINYMGIIKNQKSSKQSILVLVNGKEMVLTQGDKVEDFILSKVLKDSIELKKDKEKHYYKKQG
jgi:hypothetical protein